MKKILIINGHPDKESLCFHLAQSYKKGADNAGADVTIVNLIDLEFNPNLNFGYRKRTELEPDLQMAQKKIKESDHLVFVYPTWWSTYPAILKGFIDRVFLPTFAFSSNENSLFWKKLLKGKSARLIVTMDAPKWYYFLVYRSPGHNSLKKGVLQFCGVDPVRITSFTPVKVSKEETRIKWLNKAENLGKKMN